MYRSINKMAAQNYVFGTINFYITLIILKVRTHARCRPTFG